MRRALAVTALLVALVCGPARGDDLDAGASVDIIRITSGFTGAPMLIFGAITGTESASAGRGDVVVLLRGPEANFVVRRKEPFGPIWLNQDRTKFHAVPGFYFIASTRPLNQIAPPGVLDRYELGLGQLKLEPMKMPRAGDVEGYRKGFLAEMQQSGLYTQASGGDAVYFIGTSLFSVKIDLPESVPVGYYTVRALLIRDGNVIGDKTWQLPVEKSGIEADLYSFAHDAPLLYAFTAVAVSIFFGWAASMFFRRQT